MQKRLDRWHDIRLAARPAILQHAFDLAVREIRSVEGGQDAGKIDGNKSGGSNAPQVLATGLDEESLFIESRGSVAFAQDRIIVNRVSQMVRKRGQLL